MYEGHFSRLLIRRDEIIGRASKLAELISEDYVGKRPVLVCVLKGAAPVRIGIEARAFLLLEWTATH